MSRSLRALIRWTILLGIATVYSPAALAQKPEAAAPDEPDEAKAVGQFFTIREPITDAVIDELRLSAKPYLEQQASLGVRPILIFEFLPGETQPGQTSSGNATDLAEFLSTELSGAEQTIAYVPKPLHGYAVLDVLACDEVVMGEEASLGPIVPKGQPISEAARGTIETLARRKGRDPQLLLGMLDTSLDLREVRTADRQVHFVVASELDEFRKTHQIIQEQPAWEGAQRGVLTADRARDLNFTRLLVRNRAQIVDRYNLSNAADDPTLGGPIRPVLIRIEGPIDTVKESYLRRRIGQALGSERVNLIVFQIRSEGGRIEPSEKVAATIVRLKRQGVKTIAYVEQAMGLATLMALACDEVIIDRDGRIGDVSRMVDGGGGIEPIGDAMLVALADVASDLAQEKFHPEAIARGMVDPSVEIVEAQDNRSGGAVFLSRQAAESDPGRYAIRRTIKASGDVLTLDSREAVAFGLARQASESLDGWLHANGLSQIRVSEPTWVDALVATLNTPWMSWLLLFIGIFMLILELKLPGVGLPAITSALAFLLFFWGHYLGGTADRLEIMLFLVGLTCLALELFVFPGFGVFGVSGILLVLISVVMASHTFIWPTQDYEFRQMGRTLTQMTLTIMAVVGAAIVLGRYFPSLPFFRRMILVPEPVGEFTETAEGKPVLDPESSTLLFLIGETGRTTTVCRPSGKARIGELLVDVTADGSFLEADTPVEVIEVRGSTLFVKRIG